MCGIAGYFAIDEEARKEYNLRTLSKTLLKQIESRGRDASGYAYHGRGGDFPVVIKDDMPGGKFAQAAPLFTTRRRMPATLLLHTRKSTGGTPKNMENNHPVFSKETGLTLVHNGWVSNEQSVLNRFDLRKDGEVDTETLLRLIEHFSEEKNQRLVTSVQNALEQLEGPYACAMIKQGFANTLWMWRRRNPITMAIMEKPKMIVWASERKHLTAALKAAKMSARGVHEFPDNKVMQIDRKNRQLDFKSLPSTNYWNKFFVN